MTVSHVRLRVLLVGIIAAAVGSACSADDIFIASPISGRHVQASGERILVRFRDPADAASAVAPPDVAASVELLPDGYLAIVPLASGTSVQEALYHFRSQASVVAAEPDYIVRASRTPNDPLWARQCGLRLIELPAAWGFQHGRRGVAIAILDTGVAYDHPDLAPNLRRNHADPPDGVDDDGNGLVDDFRGWDFADGDNDPHADRGDGVGHGHGTHVAGIAAAATSNGTGIAGAGWRCTFLPVRVLDASGIGYLSDVALGIEYAVDQGAAVINLSFEGPFSRAFQAAIDYAYNRGVIICAAAGNAATEITTDPATWVTPVCNDGDSPLRNNRVIGVAAIDCSNNKVLSSNYGSAFSFIDFAAPGKHIPSTAWPGGGYTDLTGTSQAAPHVAGAAALLVSEFGPLGPDVITELLRRSAVSVDEANPAFAGKLGAGRPNVGAALFASSPGPIVGESLAVVNEVATGTLGNGRAEPGETVVVEITLKNLGAATANSVSCHLISRDPRVVVKKADAFYGSILPARTATPKRPFRLRVRRTVELGALVPLTLRVIADGAGPWRDARMRLPVGWDALGEPDDTCADGVPAVPGEVYPREIGLPLDRDWFRFDAVAKKRYVLETRPRDGSSPETAMSLRDADCGRELAASDGAGGPASIEWVCPADGRYAVMITGGDDRWGGPYEFEMSITDAGPAGPVAAARLAIDDDNFGRSAGNGDGRGDPGETVEIMAELTNRGPLPVTGISATLSSPRRGVTVVSADALFPDLAAGATGWSQFPFVVRLRPGVGDPARPGLRFDVSANEGAWTSDLRIDVGRSAVGEPDDTCADAALIQADDTHHSRAFERAGDQDWLLFRAAAGGRYRIRTWPAGDPNVDTILALHGLYCGPPIVINDNGRGGLFSDIRWDCPRSGRYGVVVRAAPGSPTGRYELSIRPLTNVGIGEPDDSCEQGVSVPRDGTPQSRDFGVPGDEDWIALPTVAGTMYIIETGPARGYVPRYVKSPPDGSPRAPDTLLELYDPNCLGPIVSDDDGGEGLFSRIVFTSTTDGAYTARITEMDGAVGRYQVWVRRNRPPRLTFTGDPGYEDDLVEPRRGAPDDTRFAFKVVYSDPNGDEPEYVRVRLFSGGVEAGISPIPLRRVSGDAASGIRYVARRTLPAGEYECKAEASDGTSPAIGPATSLTPGPLVNAPPQLTWTGEPGYTQDAHEPDSGVRLATPFVFRVIYTDADDDPPARALIRFFRDGLPVGWSPVAMDAEDPSPGGYSSGKVFTLTQTLGLGPWEYEFVFRDGNWAARGEAAGRHPGPVVNETGAALITSLAVLGNRPRSAEIRFTTAGEGRVTVRIMNLAGREVKRLAADRPVRGGLNTLVWDGTTSAGVPAPGGAYLVEVSLHADGGRINRRLAPFRW